MHFNHVKTLTWSLWMSSERLSIDSWQQSILWLSVSYSGPLATAISWYMSSSRNSCSWFYVAFGLKNTQSHQFIVDIMLKALCIRELKHRLLNFLRQMHVQSGDIKVRIGDKKNENCCTTTTRMSYVGRKWRTRPHFCPKNVLFSS